MYSSNFAEWKIIQNKSLWFTRKGSLISRSVVISRFLDDVDYATHHIDEDIFIGSEKETINVLKSAKENFQFLPDDNFKPKIEKEIQYYENLIKDWLEFKILQTSGFKEWCEKKGRKYSWCKKFYYNR